jgi:hypothetical protein
MRHRSCLHRCSLGSSHLAVNKGVSRRRDRSCSRRGSGGRVSSLIGKEAVMRRTIDVFTNHRELHIESKSVNASCIRFYTKEIIQYSLSDHNSRGQIRHTTLSSS